MSTSNSILSYLFSLIGFVPIDQAIQQQLKQQQQQQQQQGKRITSKNEESCHYLSSSTFVIEDEEKKDLQMQDWLFNLSKMALCQILSSTIADYPQVADGIYNRHYEKNFYMKKKQIAAPSVDSIEQLKSFRAQIKNVAHSLDNLRPSDQFGRASEVANSLFQLLNSPPIISNMQQQQSFISLFGLIVLAQESFNCPSEVRQHLFSDVKFGRSIILEMSKVLKNFSSKSHTTNNDIQYKWSLINNSSNTNWHDTLEFICTKLSRYDITWEYRKEYQEVVLISKRYYNIYSSSF
jgi:hypothetical protein